MSVFRRPIGPSASPIGTAGAVTPQGHRPGAPRGFPRPEPGRARAAEIGPTEAALLASFDGFGFVRLADARVRAWATTDVDRDELHSEDAPDLPSAIRALGARLRS